VTISVVTATFGSLLWEQLGHDRAIPSAKPQLANGDSRVAVHLPEETPDTLARARNLGAEDASGEWLCFLDADDELAPGYLAAMRKTLRSLNLSRWQDLFDSPKLLAPSVQYVHEDGQEEPPRLPNRQAPMAVLNHCVIGTLVPRFLFREVGGFRGDLHVYEDWALFLACARAGAEIIDVPDAVYRVHLRHGSRNQGAEQGVADTYARIRDEHTLAYERGLVFL
jgi:glycosyltransferase involved in cell wall biosynthesis